MWSLAAKSKEATSRVGLAPEPTYAASLSTKLSSSMPHMTGVRS